MRITLLFILISSIWIKQGFSQSKFKAKKHYKEAESLYEYGDYRSALTYYHKTKLFNYNLTEVTFKTGLCHYLLHQYDSALFYFKELPADFYLKDYYTAAILHKNNKLDSAETLILDYLNNVKFPDDSIKPKAKRLLQQIRFAREQINNPKKITIANIGNIINTQYDEYVPLISADNKTLYFTARWPNTTGGGTDPFGKYFEDIYKSTMVNNQWQKPQQLDTTINSELNDACVGLSPDEQKLFLFKTEPDLINGNLYVTQMGESSWEKPEKLPETINSPYVETSASITADDRTLYFSSDRPGGFGGKDIYVSTLLPDGSWSKPQNLGPIINTPFDEDAPFIHPKGNVLYFSSKGHQNMGGYDVFKVEKDDEGNWLMPQNLGYPINTVKDDIFFVLTANEKFGYYSSDKPQGYGGQDIYKISFLNTKESLIVKHGNINLRQKVKVTLVNEDDHLIEGEYYPNSNTGKFIFLIKPNTNYKLIFEYNNGQSQIYKLSNEDLLLQQTFNFSLTK